MKGTWLDYAQVLLDTLPVQAADRSGVHRKPLCERATASSIASSATSTASWWPPAM
jgi:hypothetical protein